MTTTINTIDREVARRLGARIEELTKPLEAEYGVKVSLLRGSFNSGSFTAKVNVAVVADDGQAETPDRQAFRDYAHWDGFAADDLGKTFTSQGRTFTIVGYSPRSPKRPVLARGDDGRTFKFVSAAVLRAIGKAAIDAA